MTALGSNPPKPAATHSWNRFLSDRVWYDTKNAWAKSGVICAPCCFQNRHACRSCMVLSSEFGKKAWAKSGVICTPVFFQQACRSHQILSIEFGKKAWAKSLVICAPCLFQKRQACRSHRILSIEFGKKVWAKSGVIGVPLDSRPNYNFKIITPPASAPSIESIDRAVDSKQNSQDAPRASASTHRKQREGRRFQSERAGGSTHQRSHLPRTARGWSICSGCSTRQRIFLMTFDDCGRVRKTTVEATRGSFFF